MKSNYESIISNGSYRIAEQAELSFVFNVFKDTEDDALEAAARLMKAAAQLPEGEWLGIRLETDRAGYQGDYCEGDYYDNAVGKDALKVFAFAGGRGVVAKEDHEWIFGSCAEVGDVAEAPDEPQEGAFKVYALSYVHDPADEAGEKQSGSRRAARAHLSELLSALISARASLRMIVNGGSERRGMILICLHDRMSLRMRAMLSFVCPFARAEELTDHSDSAVNALPAELMTDLTAFILNHMMIHHSTLSETDAAADEELLLDEDDAADEAETGSGDEKSDAPVVFIEDMGLSVRAYNSLRRAGVHTVDQLRDMTDEELMRVRNLGKKCFEEVREKLSKLPALSAQTEKTSATYTDMLSELIGLESVKQQVRRIAAFARMQKDMESKGMAKAPIVLNMEFIGNPGTAKTTVARIIAGIFSEIGLLKSSEIVEVGRADLVARYTGHTADQVRSVFRRAKGRLLFIDEAYSLIDSYRGGFGDEAVNTIVQEMENNRRDTVVIFAGYPDRMEELFALNPGLRTRVPFTVEFPDYSAEEMARIAELEAGKRGFLLSPEAKERVVEICGSAKGRSESGNGRFCRNLTERAILNYALRMYGEDADRSGNDNTLSPTENDYILSPEDFEPADTLTRPEDSTFQIGFRPAGS